MEYNSLERRRGQHPNTWVYSTVNVRQILSDIDQYRQYGFKPDPEDAQRLLYSDPTGQLPTRPVVAREKVGAFLRRHTKGGVLLSKVKLWSHVRQLVFGISMKAVERYLRSNVNKQLNRPNPSSRRIVAPILTYRSCQQVQVDLVEKLTPQIRFLLTIMDVHSHLLTALHNKLGASCLQRRALR